MEVHARRVPKVGPAAPAAAGSLVVVGTDRVGPLKLDSPGRIERHNR